jgi:hypothetical protein
MARDPMDAILGVGGSPSLQKLRISYRKKGQAETYVEALFNPAEISRSRSITWQRPSSWVFGQSAAAEVVRQEFVSVEAETLSLSLFFDTYEPHEESGGAGGFNLRQTATMLAQTGNPFARSAAKDVTSLTRKVARLAEVDRERHRPPICRLSWGKYKHIFTGVLTSLDQQFTMFLPNGTPVRATLNCSFTEYRTRARARAEEPHSADVAKVRVVRRGDTLHSLAAQEYNDPALWRHIARANGIVNPRLLPPGTVLTIPKLVG